MCTYSMVADHFADKWRRQYPFINTNPITVPEVSRVEFEALRKEVSEIKDLLVKAKDYDAKHGEPDCEMDEKVELLRKIAKLVGVDLGEALPPA